MYLSASALRSAEQSARLTNVSQKPESAFDQGAQQTRARQNFIVVVVLQLLVLGFPTQ